jgi:hypothetical protein
MINQTIARFLQVFCEILTGIEADPKFNRMSQEEKDSFLTATIKRELSKVMVKILVIEKEKTMGHIIATWLKYVPEYCYFNGLESMAVHSIEGRSGAFPLYSHTGASYKVLCSNTVNGRDDPYIPSHENRVFDLNAIRNEIELFFNDNRELFT